MVTCYTKDEKAVWKWYEMSIKLNPSFVESKKRNNLILNREILRYYKIVPIPSWKWLQPQFLLKASAFENKNKKV